MPQFNVPAFLGRPQLASAAPGRRVAAAGGVAAGAAAVVVAAPASPAPTIPSTEEVGLSPSRDRLPLSVSKLASLNYENVKAHAGRASVTEKSPFGDYGCSVLPLLPVPARLYGQTFLLGKGKEPAYKRTTRFDAWLAGVLAGVDEEGRSVVLGRCALGEEAEDDTCGENKEEAPIRVDVQVVGDELGNSSASHAGTGGLRGDDIAAETKDGARDEMRVLTSDNMTVARDQHQGRGTRIASAINRTLSRLRANASDDDEDDAATIVAGTQVAIFRPPGSTISRPATRNLVSRLFSRQQTAQQPYSRMSFFEGGHDVTSTVTRPDHRIRVCVLGDRNVGKTAMINQLASNSFQSTTPTTAIDVRTVPMMNPNNEVVMVEIWDLPGSPPFEEWFAISQEFFHGTVLCYSFENPYTVAEMTDFWKPTLQANLLNGPVFVLGLKNDVLAAVPRGLNLLERTPNNDDANQRLAACGFAECSALSGTNVREAWEAIVAFVLAEQAGRLAAMRRGKLRRAVVERAEEAGEMLADKAKAAGKVVAEAARDAGGLVVQAVYAVLDGPGEDIRGY
ncbi:hypothetical protein OQA88_5024 [Cercophora sp. LCS_1]